MDNPFYISSYFTPEYFCDREKETAKLKGAMENGRNVVLLSLRRMGKTGLIKHLFYKLKKENGVHVIYMDIVNARSTHEFSNILANAVFDAFSTKSKRIYDNVLKFFTRFSPVLSYDSVTGVPSISLTFTDEHKTETSVAGILDYLEKQNKPVIVAIDEFQQIVNFENKGFEAFLRSHIQHLNNVRFIFSGSQQHILTDMFSSYSRPFYQSGDYLKLERIPKDVYAGFIVRKFSETKKTINVDDVLQVLEWLDVYTFYVQNFFNKLWFISGRTVTGKDIDKTKRYVLDEHDFIYSNMSNILSGVQYKILIAIALNGGVEKPTSKDFIKKYDLGTTSTVSSAMKILEEKELIYKENGKFEIYDVFFAKWLEEKHKHQIF